MSIFEYIAIALSLFFSYAVLRLVSVLPHALSGERRYALHLGHIAFVLYAIAVTFWAQWQFRDEEWTLLRFLLLLCSPVSLYYLACILAPNSAQDIASWRDYYYSQRKPYFAVLAFWGVILFTNTTLSGLPLAHPQRTIHVTLVLVGVCGFLSNHPKVHWALLSAISAISVLAFFIMQNPDWLEA